MIKSASLGFPRIGAFRELKKAVESYWKGSISKEELAKTAAEIRKNNWQLQKDAGIDYIPSNDFSFYDHMLGMIVTVGAVPERFNFKGGNVDLDLFFTMARGAGKADVPAMEMTKWFDTNYHYLVPEFTSNQEFSFSCPKIVNHYLEAKELGFETRPVVVGPLTFLLLGKMQDGGEVLSLLPKLLPVYEEIFAALTKAGVKDIQIDEPCLVTDLPANVLNAYIETYKKIRSERSARASRLYTTWACSRYPLYGRPGPVWLQLHAGAFCRSALPFRQPRRARSCHAAFIGGSVSV